MYTRKQIVAIRHHNIEDLAKLGNVDIKTATSLYNRLVRYAKRRFRWGEEHCNGNIPTWRLKDHEHEGQNLDNLHNKLCKELEHYGLEMSMPGLCPWVDGAKIIELVWY